MWVKSDDSYHDYGDLMDFHMSTMHSETNVSGNAIRRGYKSARLEKESDFQLSDLMPEELSLDMLLTESLVRRRTSWKFGNVYTINHLAALLRLSLGVTAKTMYGESLVKKKSYASAGAEYVVRPYLVIKQFNHNLIDNRILEYDNEHEAFRYVSTLDRNKLNSICSMTKFTEQNLSYAKCTIFFVVDMSILFEKYGKLSYRLALIEAGHIAQNVQLVATALGLNSVPLGGFYDNFVRKMLQLRKDQFCLYIIATG
jgi:SagB-type dehydrogenase family enzyme